MSKRSSAAYNEIGDNISPARTDNMKRYTSASPSITLTSRPKYILEAQGYEAKLIRTPKTLASGCGYSVVTDAQPQVIAELLESYGMNYKAISVSNE